MASKERPVLVAIITAMGVIIAALITSRHTIRSAAEQRESELEARVKQLEAKLSQQNTGTAGPVEPGNGVVTSDASQTEARRNETICTPIAEGYGLRVEILGCKMLGDSVKCDFSVESTQDDRDQYLRSSRLVHNRQERGPSAQAFGKSESQGSQVYARLVRGIPVEASVTFTGISPTTGKIDLVELMFDDWAAQFRSCPVK
jgi:hypothetical protein